VIIRKAYRLDREQLIPRSIEEVFPFFSDPGNLEAITPDFLHFEITTPPPIPMGPGTIIDYRLRIFGFPVRWRTRIEVFEPPRRFVDVQIRGPYARWRHLHEFEPVPGGTRMRDRVDYEMPLAFIGAAARSLFVRKTLDRIFDFRRDRIRDLFPPAGRLPAGASGGG
jgi:ligand-binding SRPBCC domain-containing protein